MERISLLASVAVLPSVLAAALLLAARAVAEHYQLVSPSVDAILTATDVSRSRAYELVSRMLAVLPGGPDVETALLIYRAAWVKDVQGRRGGRAGRPKRWRRRRRTTPLRSRVRSSTM